MRPRELLLFGVAALVIGGATLTRAQGVVGDSVQPSGTYLHQVHISATRSVPVLITANRDGTLVGVISLLFNAGGGTAKEGPIHGIWQRKGPKTIGVTTLFFIFNANGNLIAYERTRACLTFNDDFQSYEGTEILEQSPCSASMGCPDPLDPGTVWTSSSDMPLEGYPVSGKRLQFVPIVP